MKKLPLATIIELADQPARCTQHVEFGPIDFSCPFVDEELTPLYYTPVYSTLSFEHAATTSSAD